MSLNAYTTRSQAVAMASDLHVLTSARPLAFGGDSHGRKAHPDSRDADDACRMSDIATARPDAASHGLGEGDTAHAGAAAKPTCRNREMQRGDQAKRRVRLGAVRGRC